MWQRLRSLAHLLKLFLVEEKFAHSIRFQELMVLFFFSFQVLMDQLGDGGRPPLQQCPLFTSVKVSKTNPDTTNRESPLQFANFLTTEGFNAITSENVLGLQTE